MASFNRVILMENLTRDIEIQYTPNGVPVGRMGLAMNRKFKNPKTGELREKVTFVEVVTYGKTAENAAQYLHKGSPVHIEGRLELDQWDDKETGKKRTKLYVACERLLFVGGKKPEGQAAPAGQRAPAARPGAPSPVHHEPGEELDIPEENIPF
jgi:single-strand DNA-binding protein